MYQIKVENCNNIREGMINIVLNKLNIKYGINGTGKTTLAKAIQFAIIVTNYQSYNRIFQTKYLKLR